MKDILWGRVALVVLLAEVMGVVVLALLVALFGPAGYEAAQPFANRMGQWVGPLSGFSFCLLGGWWVARRALPAARIDNGVAVGVAGAVLDVAVALALTGTLAPLLIGSNLGRIVGGTFGGWMAARRG